MAVDLLLLIMIGQFFFGGFKLSIKFAFDWFRLSMAVYFDAAASSIASFGKTTFCVIFGVSPLRLLECRNGVRTSRSSGAWNTSAIEAGLDLSLGNARFRLGFEGLLNDGWGGGLAREKWCWV